MASMLNPAADPITLEVVRNKLDGIANEMQSTLLRSSFSPIVKEGLDASASLFTLEGETPRPGPGHPHPPRDADSGGSRGDREVPGGGPCVRATSTS